MIKFSCKKCNHFISVNEKYSGKKGKCPKCGNIVIVPEKSNIIEFICEKCGHKIRVPDSYAGKKGKCPKCKNPVVVPTLKKKADSIGSVNVTCTICGSTMKIPDGSTEKFIECSGCGSYVETSSQGIPSANALKELAASSSPETDDDPDQDNAEASGDSEGIDRRLIILISGIATVVVLGILIFAVVIRFSGPPPSERSEVLESDLQVADTAQSQTETNLEEAKAFTERYISLLEKGEIDEAFELHSPELAKAVYRSSFEKLSEQIGSSRIIEMNCTQTQQHPDGQRISLWYDLNYEEGMQKVDVSVLPIGQTFKIDKITARDNRGGSLSIGISAPRSPSRPGRTAVPRRVSPSSGQFFFAIFVGFAIGTLFSAFCLWVGMKITKVEGTFVAMIGIAAISSLAGIVPLFIGIMPCVGWLISLIVLFVLICKWTDAEFWPDAIGIVLISGVVGILARMLLGFFISMA